MVTSANNRKRILKAVDSFEVGSIFTSKDISEMCGSKMGPTVLECASVLKSCDCLEYLPHRCWMKVR